MVNRLKYTYELTNNNKMKYYTIKDYMVGIDPIQTEKKRKSIKDLEYDECVRLNSQSDIEKLSQVDPEFDVTFFKRGGYKYYYPKHNGYSRKAVQEDTVYFLEELQEFIVDTKKYGYLPTNDEERRRMNALKDYVEKQSLLQKEEVEKSLKSTLTKKGEFDDILDSLKRLLNHKNKQYGNSALQPMNVFSGKCKVGQRIDDKLARVANSKELRTNDLVDILGYLVLVCKEKGWDNFDKFKD